MEGKRVFLCYRQHDAFAAGRIAEFLKEKLGADSVFRYIEHPGVRFEDIIQALLSCHVVVLVIGDRWLTTASGDGRRRLDDPNDFLRLEIEWAFGRHLPVLPVLVEGASLGFPDDFPDSLKPLSRINPLHISDQHFDQDSDRLLIAISNAKPDTAPLPPGEKEKITAQDLVLIWTSWRSPENDYRNPSGGPVYRFDVVIGASPSVLDRIEKVIYFLPPAWGSRSPALIDDRPAAFRLKETAWWDLTVRARVYVRDQADVIPLSTHVWLMEAGKRI